MPGGEDDNVEPLVPKDKQKEIEEALQDAGKTGEVSDEVKERILRKIKKKQGK